VRETLRILWSLLASVALLLVGVGLFNTFIGLRAAAEGFATETVGLMMSGYFVGLVAGTLRCGRLVNRVGHIRAFAAFCGLTAALVCLFPFLVSAPAWFLLRVLLGFNLAGLYMVAESWLNDRATPQTRGTMLSFYMMTTYLALGAGQFLLNAGDLAGLELFMITAMALSLAVVPVAVTRAPSPSPVEAPHFGFARLYAVSPVAVTGCICSGACIGALYGMGPVYAQRMGLSLPQISQFMGILVLSGLALQLPIGRLSDRYDRRDVITAVAGACGLASLLLVVFASHSTAGLFVLAALYGGTVATLYPLSIAYANDYLEPEELVPASGGLVLAFAAGAAVGPLAAATLMRALGPAGLFAFSAAVAAALVAFCFYRMRRRSWAPVWRKEAFVALPDATTTPISTDVDPRAREEEDEAPPTPFDFGARAAYPETQEVLRSTRRRWKL